MHFSLTILNKRDTVHTKKQKMADEKIPLFNQFLEFSITGSKNYISETKNTTMERCSGKGALLEHR